MSLILDIGKEDYIPIVGEAEGVVIVLGNPGEIAFPEEEGVFALPGRNTAVGVKYVSNRGFNERLLSNICGLMVLMP